MLNIRSSVDLTPEAKTRLDDLISNHPSLEKILIWCTEQIPPVKFDDMIQQDEFTSDLILPFEAGFFLVYDVT
jgi:hypothetical protein